MPFSPRIDAQVGPLPVAIYARYSTDRQDSRSIDDQVRRCRGFAGQRGHTVAAEYADAAISGSHTERLNLQRLLADARRGAFRHVLVDDLSRLSRDLGDAWRLIFSEFAASNVSVIDVNSGLHSDAQGARMAFGAMALISDGFLQMIRAETHRGLEGRALAGFATGGKTFGFSTVVEPNPPVPDHPRKVRVIVPDEAALVLRVFGMYLEGMSLKGIAAKLNADRIPAPHDNGRGHKLAPGWGHSTIRSMLRNAQYIGVWTWNREKWVQIPGTAGYRRIPRPVSEHVRKDVPHLRIVPQAIWEEVQAKLRKRGGAGRPAGTGKYETSLLSGLLKCGVCGGSITIVSRHKKNGVGYANLGCTTRNSRGLAACSNSKTIAEKKITDAVVAELRALLTEPKLVERFVSDFKKEFDAQHRALPGGAHELRRQVEQAERRIKNLTGAMARMGFSEGVLTQLAIEEETLKKRKRALASATRAQGAVVIPHPKLISDYIENLLATLDMDRAAARALLAKHMPPLVLTPEGTGYRATGGFNLSLCLDLEASPRPSGSAAPGATVPDETTTPAPDAAFASAVCGNSSRRDRD